MTTTIPPLRHCERTTNSGVILVLAITGSVPRSVTVGTTSQPRRRYEVEARGASTVVRDGETCKKTARRLWSSQNSLKAKILPDRLPLHLLRHSIDGRTRRLLQVVVELRKRICVRRGRLLRWR